MPLDVANTFPIQTAILYPYPYIYDLYKALNIQTDIAHSQPHLPIHMKLGIFYRTQICVADRPFVCIWKECNVVD